MTLLALDAFLLIEKLALIVIIVFATLGVALYTTFAERKVAAILQDRPNRAIHLVYYNHLPMELKCLPKKKLYQHMPVSGCLF
jgi:NADH-quinone oxidoreductase subunit H